MTFDQLWREVERQNPELANGTAVITRDGFRKAMQLAWTKGKESGIAFAKSSNPIAEIADVLFNGRKAR